MNEVENTPLGKRNEEEQGWKHSGREEFQGRTNSDSTSVETEGKNLIKWKELEQKDTTLRLDG